MSNEIMNSVLLVELSEQEQELVAGGFGPRKFGSGRPPIALGSMGGDFGGQTPFGDDEEFDGFPFNKDEE